MNDAPPPTPTIPLKAAHRIHRACEQFEDAWSGPTRPQFDAFLADVPEPERWWLLTELLALEVELRRGAGEQPTEADYRLSFPGEGDRNVIAAAFRRCADAESHRSPHAPRDVSHAATARHGRHHAERDDYEAKPSLPSADSSTKAPSKPQVEGYDILEVLGRGGMGVVYKVRHLRLKRLVALKMILAGDHAGPEQRARFRTEAEMVARLQHPNIVQIFDVGEQDGHPYIAFEFIEGKTLSDCAGREPQPARVAAELLEAMARAVQYAHQQGIVHRDLKPANVLVSGIGPIGRMGPIGPIPLSTPKITDFGLAKDLAANLERTSTGTILGTPLYMSPEQAEGGRDIGPASDIYSLGAILYALLIGRPPFQGTTPISTLKMVVSTEPVPPSQLQPHLARDLETICLKCLHKDPARRYETAGALADDLRRFLNDEPILARASGRIEKTWRWCRHNPAVAALMASVLLVLVAGVVVSSYFAYTATKEAEESSRLATVAQKAEKDARDEKDRAEANAQRARERAYVSDLRLVPRAWDDKLFILFFELLDGQRPARTENVEVRGFEWHYWRRLARSFGIVGHHSAIVRSVCFSPDGTRIASGSADRTVKVWDAVTGQEQLTLHGHTNAVYSVCFSPDGKQIVSGSLDKTAKVWDAATGQEKLTCKGHTEGVVSVCFSPNGKQIVSGSGDKTVKVWDARTGQEKLTFKGHTDAVHCVCYSPDGTRIVSGSGDRTVKVWDVRTGQKFLSLKGHTDAVYAVSYSRDGKRLASGSFDRTVKVWDAETGQEKHTLKGHSNLVVSVCFSPDSTQIVSSSNDGTAKVWDAATGAETFTYQGHTNHVYSVCFSPDGKQIVSGSSDATVRVWDALAASKAPAFEGHQSQVTCLACSPNSRWLASSGGNWNGAGRYTAGELRLWDVRTGALVRDLAGHSSGVTCVGFSPDDRYLASGSGVWDEAKRRYTEGEVRLWDPASGAPLKCLEGHASSVVCVAFSPDSRFLASGGLTGDVLVRRLPQGQDAFTLPGLSQPVTTLAFSPDGRVLVGGGHDGVVKVWNLTDRSEVASLPAPAAVSRVAFSPDGKQLAVANYSNELVLYDTTTYKEVRRLQGHTGALTHVVYSPDGKRLATASEDRTVRLWDSSSGQEMLTLTGHTSIVRCVTFSPDGQRLFSGGWDRTIRIWDATPLD